MKRIILILALLSLGVSKAQVVGGYLPLNSTKSATMGGLRVNGNETVTGTFSVGSTATVANLYSAGTIRSASGTSSLTGLNNNGNLITSTFESTSTGYMDSKLRVGSVVAPSATLDVTGTLGVSSTFSLGSANLTGGNTGTVAVLSDAVFCTQSSHKPYDPADGITIYFANNGYLGLTTNATNNRIYVPKNCTLIGYDITGYIDGSSSTTETSTISIRIDNTTDVTLNSSITYSTTYQQWHSMALSTDINSGSYFNLKWVTPTWVTNPTSVINSVVLWFKLR